ncbi:MAG: FAD binding domain-containing protein [Bacteroidia bacterium]
MKTESLFLKPANIQEALDISQKYGDACRFLAGGTDVMPTRFQENDATSCLVDISALHELKGIVKVNGYLVIGSLVTLSDLINTAEIKKHFPVLIEAATSVASPVIRKSATLGGNLLCENRCLFYNQSAWWREAVGYCLKCNGDICIATGGAKNCFSKFVSDMAVVLISLNAELEIASSKGVRIEKLEAIYTGDGLNPRTITGSSVIRAIHIPVASQVKTVFKKLRQRKSLEFTSLTTAVSLHPDGELKIVLGGVDPKPVTVVKNVQDKQEEIITHLLKKCRVVENDVYSRPYRREMIKVFLKQSFQELGLT